MANFKVVWFSNHDSYMFSLEKDEFNPERFLRFLVETKLRSARGRNDWNANMEQRNDQYISIQYLDIEDELISLGTLESEFESFKKCVSVMMSRKNMVTLFASFKQKLNSDEKLDLFSKVMEPKQEKGKQSGSKSGSEQGDGSKLDNEQGVGSESGNEQGVKKPSSSLLGEPGMQNSIFITDEELPEYLVECTSPDGTPGLRSLNGDEKTLQRVLFEIMHAIRKHVLGKSFPCGYNKIVFWPDKSHALIGFTDNTFVLFEDKNKETCPETMGRLGEKTRRLNSFLKFIEAGLASYVDLQPAVPTVPWMEDYMKKFKTSLIQEVRGAVKEIVDKSPSNSDNIFDDGVYQVATMEADDDPLHKETEALFMLYTKEMFNKTFNAGICDCIHVNGSLNFVTDRPLQDYVFPDSVYTVHIGVSARGAVIPGLSRPEDEFQLAINTASKFRLYTELVKFDANEDFGFWSAAIKIKVPAIVGTYRIFFELLLANLSVGVKIPLVLIAPDIAGTPCLVSELNDNPLYKGINKNPYIRPSNANENPLQRALIPEAVVAVRDDGQKDDKDEGYDDTDEINNNNQEKEKDVAVKAKDSAINNPEDEQQHAAVNNNQEDEQHAVVNDQEKEKDSAINDQEKEKDSAINNLEKEKDDSVVSNNNNKMNNEIAKDSEYFSDCSSDSSASLLCDAKEILEKIFVDGVDNRLALPACFMPNLSTPKEKDVKPDSAKQAILETFDPLRNNEVKVELPKKTSPVSDIEIERLTDEVFKMHGKFFGEDDSSWVDVENIFGGDIYSSKQEQQQMQQQQMQQQQVQQQVQQQQVLQQQVEQQQMQQQVLQQQVEQQQMQQHVLQQQVEQQQMQQQVLQQQVEQQQMQQQVEQQQMQQQVEQQQVQQQQVEQQQMQQQQAQQQVQHGFTCSVATAGATATTVTTMTTAAHPHTANKMDEPPVDEDNSFRGIRKPPVEILPMSVLNAIGHMMSIGDPHKRQQNQQAAHALMEQHRYQKPVSVSQFDQAKALLEQHRYQKPISVSQFDQAKALIEQHRYQKPVSVSQYDQGKALLEQHRYQKPVSVSQYDQAKALMEQHSRYQKPVSLAEFDRYMHDMHYNKHAEPILKGIYDDYQTKLTTARIAACHLQQPYQQEQQQQQQYQPTIAVTPSFFTNPYPSHQHHHQQQQEQQQEPRHQQVKDNYIRTQSQSAQNPLLSGLLYGGQHQTTATSQMLPSSNPVSPQTTPPYVSQQSKLGYHGFPLQASYASQSTLMQPRTPKSDASQLSRSSMGQTAGLSQYAVSHLSSAGSTQCGGVSQSPTSSGGLSQYAVSETPVTGSSSPQYNMPQNPPIQTSTELWDMKIPSQTTSFASQQYEIMSSQQTPGGLTQTVIMNATDGRSADGMLNGTADGRSTNVISNGPDYRPVGGLSTGTTDGNRSANVNHHGYDITGGAHILDQQQPPY